jgi:hypothetical protein
MIPNFKRVAMLALLAIALVACDMGTNTPTPLTTYSPAAQAVATPTIEQDSGEQTPSEPSPAERPATTVLPDSDPINPIDRVPELGSKPTLPITPPTTLATPAGAASPTPAPSTGADATGCTPTRTDAEGPFYEPNAPERTSIGKGHVLRGVVRSSDGCRPVPGAQLEFWQVNDRAEYDDDHRATMFSDSSGAYSFESNFPQPYSGRPSHIHLRVTADGYQTLTTQFYPQPGETEATFDIVLVAD